MLYIKQTGGTAQQRDNTKPRKTPIKSGDIIVFHTKDRTVSIMRPSLSNCKGLRFGPPGRLSWDDKCIFNFEDPGELIQISELIGVFFGLQARFRNKEEPTDKNGLVRIEFIKL